jgi:hypothetical protein
MTTVGSQVPHSQTGVANGILALELVTGSLTGFGLFHFYFGGHVQDMYGLYICIVVRRGLRLFLFQLIEQSHDTLNIS